jgi:cellulose synthase/poly-beta-1,6-N-acetylglucosamine synthase-like glycosyltransferase
MVRGSAEDLVTAIRIHSAGWKSVYAPIVVSRGLVPEDSGSFCKQQLKWSRGVFEVLFTEIPNLFGKLTWWQRLSYMTIWYLLFRRVDDIFVSHCFPFLFFWFGLHARPHGVCAFPAALGAGGSVWDMDISLCTAVDVPPLLRAEG